MGRDEGWRCGVEMGMWGRGVGLPHGRRDEGKGDVGQGLVGWRCGAGRLWGRMWGRGMWGRALRGGDMGQGDVGQGHGGMCGAGDEGGGGGVEMWGCPRVGRRGGKCGAAPRREAGGGVGGVMWGCPTAPWGCPPTHAEAGAHQRRHLQLHHGVRAGGGRQPHTFQRRPTVRLVPLLPAPHVGGEGGREPLTPSPAP